MSKKKITKPKIIFLSEVHSLSIRKRFLKKKPFSSLEPVEDEPGRWRYRSNSSSTLFDIYGHDSFSGAKEWMVKWHKRNLQNAKSNFELAKKIRRSSR